MTRQTALDLVKQQDLNNLLAQIGRITLIDMRALHNLQRRAAAENRFQVWEDRRELARTLKLRVAPPATPYTVH